MGKQKAPITKNAKRKELLKKRECNWTCGIPVPCTKHLSRKIPLSCKKHLSRKINVLNLNPKIFSVCQIAGPFD